MGTSKNRYEHVRVQGAAQLVFRGALISPFTPRQQVPTNA